MWGYSALAASTRAIVPPSSGRYFHAAPSPPPKHKVCAAVFHSEAIRIGSRNRARQQWHVTGPTD